MPISIDFNGGWKYQPDTYTGPRNQWGAAKAARVRQGPEAPDFYDGDWQEVTLPHDYRIGEEPVEESEWEKSILAADPEAYAGSEGDRDFALQIARMFHTNGGYFPRRPGWYRKHFRLDAANAGSKVILRFEGVFRHCSIYLNHFFIMRHESGYAGFDCDISDFAAYGSENVLAIRVDPGQPEGWFYEGAGLYRPVRLMIYPPAHIGETFIYADIRHAERSAVLHIETDCGGLPVGCALEAAVYDPSGQKAGEAVITAAEGMNRLQIELKDIFLWETGAPRLYEAGLTLRDGPGGNVLDEYRQKFGLRSIRFDPENGFFLNGKPLKLKGVCLHQHHAGVGAALTGELYEFRIRKLLEMGCNAIRTSHYPPAPELLEVCDRLGMLVFEENRLFSSAPEDLGQLRWMVHEGRNHPSVILYGIGNEEGFAQVSEQGPRIARTMIRTISRLDPTRPITMALLLRQNPLKPPMADIPDVAPIAKQLDVAGFNYHEEKWAEFHRQYPDLPMIGTEQTGIHATRGCYRTCPEKAHLAINDASNEKYLWGPRIWKAAQVPYMSGIFVWTGFDYYGEPKPFPWPAISSQFGILDLCGFPKDSYYYYRSMWREEPLIHTFPAWEGEPGEMREQYIFSNCEEVELRINGTCLGRRVMPDTGYLIWPDLPYEPGKLEVIGYRQGPEAAREELYTAGPPAGLRLIREAKIGKLSVYRAELRDREGHPVTADDRWIRFEIESPDGKARILGTGNGDPSDHTPAHSPERRSFHGLAQLLTESEGDAEVRAICGDLTSAIRTEEPAVTAEN